MSENLQDAHIPIGCSAGAVPPTGNCCKYIEKMRLMTKYLKPPKPPNLLQSGPLGDGFPRGRCEEK